MMTPQTIKKLNFSSKHGCNYQHELTQYEQHINKEITQMKQALKNEYEDDRCSIYLTIDESIMKQVLLLVEKKQALNPEYLIVVGIGGSNLGTIAVQEAIYGRLYNQKNPDMKILYADTVDADQISDIIHLMENVLKKGKNIVICGISKSGGTTETIANLEVLISLLHQYKSDHEKYIVTITDDQSKLYHFAVNNNYAILEIPKKVGGRYSVFSPVGLFPLAMIGIDIKALVAGAKDMMHLCLNTDIESNPAAHGAMLLYHQYLKNIKIHDLFLFHTDFESIGKWYRQLLAESIGKEYDKNGEKIYAGITPTVSIGSVDLHSMAQLYLAGPYDKITTFISVKKNKQDLMIPSNYSYEHLVSGIQSRPMKEIMDAILVGTKKAFIKGNRPFMEIVLPDKSAEAIGQLLQMKMMQTMYLGALMNVNPFDQPNVEAYKIETRKELEQN